MKVKRSEMAMPKIDMTPMIDCVFQLIAFFMLTLRIVADEANFDINMPIGQRISAEAPPIPPIKVRMIADEEGNLASIQLGGRRLGNDAQAFRSLNQEILSLARPQGGNRDLEVELDADYNLKYSYTIQAIGASSGRVDPRTKKLVRFVESVKFAPPRKPR